MSATTTIRLPPELRTRVARAAERAGVSSHSFIIDAIAEKAEREERRDAFVDEAELRFARVAESGETIPWQEMREFLGRRVSDPAARPPRSRKLAR